MPLYPLTNFEIQKYHQNEPKCDGVYSKHNLSQTKDGTYLLNFSDFKSIG